MKTTFLGDMARLGLNDGNGGMAWCGSPMIRGFLLYLDDLDAEYYPLRRNKLGVPDRISLAVGLLQGINEPHTSDMSP